MKKVKQLAVFLENQPGALLRVTSDLKDKQINILALSVLDGVDHAVVRMVVDKPTETLHLLGEAGVLVVENELLEIDLSNKPGVLTTLCEALSDIKTNIEYAYGSAKSDGGNFYLRLKNIDKAMETLKEKIGS